VGDSLVRDYNLQPVFEQDEDEGPASEQDIIQLPRLRQNIQRDHPVGNILGSLRKRVTTHLHLANFCQYYSFIFSLEPLKVDQALGDPECVMVMQENSTTLKGIKYGHWWKDPRAMSLEPNGSSATNKMSMVWLQGTRRLVAQGFTQGSKLRRNICTGGKT
jgi:hypothetical protein